jgi:hypothetical protein
LKVSAYQTLFSKGFKSSPIKIKYKRYLLQLICLKFIDINGIFIIRFNWG